ncbi:TPA: hypothetical protein ACK1SE_002087 [Proteus mirabilis]
MKIKTNWVIYFALLPFWQKVLLSLATSIIVSLLCYLFGFSRYQQNITAQQLISQHQTQIQQLQSILHLSPAIALLKALQNDYKLPQQTGSVYQRIQQIIDKYHLIPHSWQISVNNSFKLRFSLSYSQLLTLLAHLHQAGCALSALLISPIPPDLLSVELNLVDITTPNVLAPLKSE